MINLRKLIAAAITVGDTEQRAQDTEARLRARDGYLQKAIMDTAHQVQELEQRVHDLQSVNEELRGEVVYARQYRDRLEIELAELDDDNLMLQNELTKAEIDAADIALPPSPEEIESEGLRVWEDEYVLLRDIATQVDLPDLEGVALPALRRASVSVSVGTDAEMSLPNRSITTQTYDAAKPEAMILSLLSRLTYANMMTETQQETIEELEQQIGEATNTIDRLNTHNWELKLRDSHLSAIADANTKVIEELVRSVTRLEQKRTANTITKDVLALIAATDSPANGGGTGGMGGGGNMMHLAQFLGLKHYPPTEAGGYGPPRQAPRSPLPSPPLDVGMNGGILNGGVVSPSPIKSVAQPQPTQQQQLPSELQSRMLPATPPPTPPNTQAPTTSLPPLRAKSPTSRSFRFQARKTLVATPPDVHRLSVELHRKSLDEGGRPLEFAGGDGSGNGGDNGGAEISAGGPSPLMVSKARRVSTGPGVVTLVPPVAIPPVVPEEPPTMMATHARKTSSQYAPTHKRTPSSLARSATIITPKSTSTINSSNSATINGAARAGKPSSLSRPRTIMGMPSSMQPPVPVPPIVRPGSRNGVRTLEGGTRIGYDKAGK